MRQHSVSLLAGCLALLATALVPAAVEAKSYQGDGAKLKHRSMTSRSNSGGSGSSSSCLTSEARNLLGRIRSQFGNVQIISTCRPGARIASSGKPSKHASGRAIDFRVPGKKKQVVAWLMANHHSGGTMTYSDMDHIHVDVGSRFVALNRPSGH